MPTLQGQATVDVEATQIQKLASSPEFYGSDFDDFQRIQMLEVASPTFASLDDEPKQQAYQKIVGKYNPNTFQNQALRMLESIPRPDFNVNRPQVKVEPFQPMTPELTPITPGFAMGHDGSQPDVAGVALKNLMNAGGAALYNNIAPLFRGDTYQGLGQTAGNAFQTELESGANDPLSPFKRNIALGGSAVGGLRNLAQGVANIPGDVMSAAMGQQQNPNRINLPELPQQLQGLIQKYPVTSFVGENLPYALPITKAARTGKILPTALEGAGVGFAMDPGQGGFGGRVTNAAMGATFPAVIGGVSKGAKGLQGELQGYIQKGVKPPRNTKPIQPKAQPVVETNVGRMMSQTLKRQVDATLKELTTLADQIRTGKIPVELVNEPDIARLAAEISKLREFVTGVGKRPDPQSLSNTRNFAAIVRKRAVTQAKKKGTPLNLEQETATPTETTTNAQGETTNAPSESQGLTGQVEVTEKKPVKPLTGSVKEMVEQGLEDTGMTLDEAKALVDEVDNLGSAEKDPIILKLKEEKKALGNKKDDATKEARARIDAQIEKRKQERKTVRDKAAAINPNLRQVLKTDWDGKSPTANQLPVDPEKQLTYDDVADLVTNPEEKKLLGQIDKAAQEGKTARVEHRAEITGSTDAAGKVTSTGNVKIPPSDFTPTHYGIVKKDVNGQTKEFVVAHGYNEAGYESQYYITRSPEGSRIEKVGKVLDKENFVGATPNVYLGQRKFKVGDVLGRKPRAEGVLTTQAETNAQLLAKLFEKENFKTLSPEVQKFLRGVNKRGRFEKAEMSQLLKLLEGKKEQLAAVCNLFGLK